MEDVFVSGKPRAHLLHAAEGANGDAAIRFATPRAPPVLQAHQLLWGFLDERFDGVLIGHPVAAGDGVVGVLVEAVVLTSHTGRTAFGGDGVAAHGVDLRDDGDPESWVGLGDGDGGAQSSATTAHHEDVVRWRHGSSWLFGREQLIHHDAAVVANDLPAHTPIVVFMVNGPAAARVVDLQREYRLLIAVLVGLAIHDPPAGGVLLREAGFRGDHRPPPSDARGHLGTELARGRQRRRSVSGAVLPPEWVTEPGTT